MPVAGSLLEDLHDGFQMRTEGCTGMCGHFAYSCDSAFLDFEKGCSDMENEVTTIFIFVIGIIQGTKVTSLFSLFGRFELAFVSSNNLNEVRHKLW
mmetsp:Transcript_32419/g.93231  ORF Transcript_32419/g.93231 Transcript_32419/m.93231 type:complete len:96 (-) Transcript_32419:213-500(-)